MRKNREERKREASRREKRRSLEKRERERRLEKRARRSLEKREREKNREEREALGTYGIADSVASVWLMYEHSAPLA